IDGGLHGTEVAPAQLLPQLAYDLVTGADKQAELIRENVIALLVFANPDGMTIVSDWYMGNVGTPYEVSSIPWLYHKYVGHDNNRDSFTSNLIETQNMNLASTGEWYPEVLYNQHQRGPFPARIWIPPDAEPTNPNVHPLIVRWKNLIGSAMGKAFDENKQPGAISRIRYDTWYPGYATQVMDGHNTVSILTETQLYSYATPQHFTLSDFPEAHRDLTMGVFYPNPWLGGWWRLGDAVAYNSTACKAVLEVTARYRPEILFNKYTIGSDVIERFKNEPPYGWIISTDQRDKNTAALLMNRLMVNGIEIYTADEEFEHNGITYPQSSYIIPASQPFGLFAKNILEKQDYPDLRKYSHLWQGLVNPETFKGDPLRPYDGVGWTLPLQFGIEYNEMSSLLKVAKTRITEAAPNAGRVTGGGSYYSFTHADNNSFKALNMIFEAGGKLSLAAGEFSLGGVRFEKGAFMVESGSISSSKLNEIAREVNIDFTGGSPRVEKIPINNPRIALYKSWVASMDAGWMTYIFDRFGFDYHLLTNAEVKAGGLNERFDVIILADQRTSQIIDGHKKGTIPPDYSGGISWEGTDNLKEFVDQGGTLVCNNGSSGFALDEFDIPVKNVLRSVPADSFNCPGSILKMNYNTDHPLAFGMPNQDIAFFSRGMAFEIKKAKPDKETNERPENSPEIIAEYPDGKLLISGWMLGEERLRKKAAVVNIPRGEGNIVLFGFNVHNRSQAYSTMKLLFNSLYYKK
ncbi:M14 family metallopeptidase, partial [candidate division KSB1 bacterium]